MVNNEMREREREKIYINIYFCFDLIFGFVLKERKKNDWKMIFLRNYFKFIYFIKILTCHFLKMSNKIFKYYFNDYVNI